MNNVRLESHLKAIARLIDNEEIHLGVPRASQLVVRIKNVMAISAYTWSFGIVHNPTGL